MQMEPHIVVITRQPVSRVAVLLREAGYFVTKVAPEHTGDTATAEALVVELRLFELMQWLGEHADDGRMLIVAPSATFLKGLSAPTLRPNEIEAELITAIDRIVANGRTAALRAS
jgi:hypothetical protein